MSILGCMNGKQIGALLNQWQSSKDPLTDEELTELIEVSSISFPSHAFRL